MGWDDIEREVLCTYRFLYYLKGPETRAKLLDTYIMIQNE